MYNYGMHAGSGSSQKGIALRTLERYAFAAKRDFFSFLHLLFAAVGPFAALGPFELLCLFAVGGLSQRMRLERHRRRGAVEKGALGWVVPASTIATATPGEVGDR